MSAAGMLSAVVFVELRLDVADKLEQFLHRLVPVGLDVAIDLLDLLLRLLLDLCLHVSA